MPIKYFGRSTNFCGKTLWEILGNLQNFGVGRIVVRSVFERYPEPSYLRITKVEPLPYEENRKVTILAERVFRGRIYPEPVQIKSVSYKADYRLIPKKQEDAYTKRKFNPRPERVVPGIINLPPILNERVKEDLRRKNVPVPNGFIKIPNLIKQGRDNLARSHT